MRVAALQTYPCSQILSGSMSVSQLFMLPCEVARKWLSTRNYGAVVHDSQDAYGIEQSAVSENFIEASREKVKELTERRLDELRLCAVLIDGTPFKDRHMIVARGIGSDGRKNGARPARGNAAGVNGLLSKLVERGLDFAN